MVYLVIAMASSMEFLLLLALHSTSSCILPPKISSKKQTWACDPKMHHHPVLKFSSYDSDPPILHHSCSDGMTCCFLKHQILSQPCAFFCQNCSSHSLRNSDSASDGQLKNIILYQASPNSSCQVGPVISIYFAHIFSLALFRSSGSWIYPFVLNRLNTQIMFLSFLNSEYVHFFFRWSNLSETPMRFQRKL